MIRGMIQIALLRSKSSEGKEGDGLIRNLEEYLKRKRGVQL